jgi:kynurenine/2-aminoadipate aminotransferase
MNKTHLPTQREYGICVSSGGQDALQRAFDCVLDEEDSLIMEESTYSGSIAAIRPVGCNIVEAPLDEHGVVPEALQAILESWNVEERKSRRPKAIYLVPTANNPTSATIPNDRRHQIYAICKKYNMLIFEDDPYPFLLNPQRGST